jgi:hypothetical protein
MIKLALQILLAVSDDALKGLYPLAQISFHGIQTPVDRGNCLLVGLRQLVLVAVTVCFSNDGCHCNNDDSGPHAHPGFLL